MTNSDLQTQDYPQLRASSEAELREAIRAGRYTGHTAGLAPGRLQANLAILPEQYALDFMRYCQRNPKPCPLVGVSETGNALLQTLGHDLDIRTDVPAYNIYREGKLADTVTDISSLWTDELVVFALGCSFTFEIALIDAGIPMHHIENNQIVPMYRSNLMTTAAGPFGGEMVVTMRAVQRHKVDEAIRVSSRYPLAHGGPVHVGDPAEIGITNLSKPDWGDPPPAVADDHVPLYWACGVTPQNAIMRAQLPLSITHKPGCMLITGIDEQAEVPVI